MKVRSSFYNRIIGAGYGVLVFASIWAMTQMDSIPAVLICISNLVIAVAKWLADKV